MSYLEGQTQLTIAFGTMRVLSTEQHFVKLNRCTAAHLYFHTGVYNEDTKMTVTSSFVNTHHTHVQILEEGSFSFPAFIIQSNIYSDIILKDLYDISPTSLRYRDHPNGCDPLSEPIK